MIYLHPDLQYKSILRNVIHNGVVQNNRTNYSAKFIPSASIVWNLKDGFPALTSKKLFFKQSIGEIIGFIRGARNVKDFRELGCRFWDSDANENKTWLKSPYRKGNDDLGLVYGATWRKHRVYKEAKTVEQKRHVIDNGWLSLLHDIFYKDVDQFADCVDKIMNYPEDRRNIFHAWFPELFDEMALPPCHVMYEFVPDKENKILHLTMTQRSCDLLLGVPMNLFGSALILSLIAKATGYAAGVVTLNMTNVHLYENQIEAANIQLDQDIHPLCKLHLAESLKKGMAYLESVMPREISLVDYKHSNALPKIEMAQEK